MDLAVLSIYCTFMHVSLCFLNMSNRFMRVVLLCRFSETTASWWFWTHLVPKNVVFKLFSDMKREKMAELPFSLLKRTRGGHFNALFFRPFKLKRSPGVCHFALVTGSKTTCFWPLFYFFGSKSLFTKSTPRSFWSGGSFEYCFILFRARETQLYEKGPPLEFPFLLSFQTL